MQAHGKEVIADVGGCSRLSGRVIENPDFTPAETDRQLAIGQDGEAARFEV